MDPSVAVVIPVFNRHRQIQDAVRSALNQSLPPTEVIVIDDASEPSIQLSAELISNDSVRLLRLDENVGASRARQLGLESASAQFVAFLDSDDTWFPPKLEQQIRLLAELDDPEMAAIGCAWDVVDAEGVLLNTRRPRGSSQLVDFCSGCWYAPGSTVLMSRETLMTIGGFNRELRRLEDLEMFIRFASAGGYLAIAPVVGASITRGGNARLRDVVPAVDQLRRQYLRRNSSLSAQARRRLRAWLDIEVGATAYGEGHRIRAAALLVRSLIRAPRFRVQIRNWWDRSPLP